MSRYIPVSLGVSKLGLKAEDFLSGSDIASIEKQVRPGEVEVISLDDAVLEALRKDIGVEVGVDVLATMYVWPHVECEHWHCFLFLNYCLTGFHTFGQVGRRGLVDQCSVMPGSCFVVDPSRIHWLEPNGGSSEVCLLLQFAVPRRDKKSFNKIVDWMLPPF
jgi:hypothetical protein